MKSLERTFERVLWQSRLLVVVAVVASAFLALGAFYMATVDVVLLLGNLLPYASPTLESSAREALRETIVTGIVKAVDGYLIAAIVLIFALGLYELFINKIDHANVRVAEILSAAGRVVATAPAAPGADPLRKRVLIRGPKPIWNSQYSLIAGSG